MFSFLELLAFVDIQKYLALYIQIFLSFFSSISSNKIKRIFLYFLLLRLTIVPYASLREEAWKKEVSDYILRFVCFLCFARFGCSDRGVFYSCDMSWLSPLFLAIIVSSRNHYDHVRIYGDKNRGRLDQINLFCVFFLL